MKNILLILMLVILCVINAFAQQKKQTHNMLISIYEQEYGIFKTKEKVIITKEDGTQEVKEIKINSSSYAPKNIQATEDSVVQLLKPWFDDGWKLVTSMVVTIPQTSGNDFLTRYFLRKDEE